MAKYIQLYLDTDFILPIGVGDSGNINKYIDQQASRRLWLYFSRTTNNVIFDSTESNRANFVAGREGFYGNFWMHIENGDKVPGESYKYIELLDLSRIISKLRDWSNETIFTETPEIVLNFSTVIPVKARKVFAAYLEEKLGKIRSYSIELNNMLSSKVLYDNQTLSPSFGDQLLIIQSVGYDILMSTLTWCGDQFMQGDEPFKLRKKGGEYLKEALAKMVVNRYEQSYHMLLPVQLENEYHYQMQFTDEWLKERKGDEDIWIENFHYSNNLAKFYPPIQIDGKQLNLIERDSIRNTINAVSKYYRKNIVNKHLHTILVGDVFKEEVFLKDCVSVTSSDSKYTFFNDNALQEALGRYNVKYSYLEEDLVNLERIFRDKANERSRISAYVHNAEILASLSDGVQSAIREIDSDVYTVNDRNMNLKTSWESLMRQSKFDNASELIAQMSISDDLTISKNHSLDILKKIERNNALLIELQQLQDVRPTIEAIRNGGQRLRELNAKADDLKNLPEILRATIQKYRALYPQYKELRQQFDMETTLVGRRTLVDKMKELTMETMPVIDIEVIKGNVSVKLISKSGFLGMGVKKSIDLKLVLDKPLPCRGVLVVSPKVITCIPEGRIGVYTIDVDKGKENTVVELNVDLQTLGLEKNAKSLFIRFWPHEDEKVPINRFDISGSGTIIL